MRVRYRRRALSDIEGIHDYVAARNPRAAMEVIARIREAADRLGDWPYMGHAGQVDGTYEWVVARLPYVYELDGANNELAIIAVFHGAQHRNLG